MIAVSELRDPELSGVVLCGGRSLRMGRDKARLELAGRSLLERAIDALDPICTRVFLATGSEARYEELGREVVLDGDSDAGPLAGLVAALEVCPTEWLAVVGCDMPGARPELFGELLAVARDGGYDLVVAESGAGTEPLLAIYHRRCAVAARRTLDAGRRRLVDFHEGLKVGRHELADEGWSCNVNTPEDLEREREREI